MERQTGSGRRRVSRFIQSIEEKTGNTHATTPNEVGYFPALTGIRAIAAWMVFLHHYKPFEHTNQTFLKSFTNELHVGVTLFFVLSGFLISYRYMALEKFQFRNYMVSRIAKIYPVFILLTGATILVYGLKYSNIPLNDKLFVFLMNITFLKGFFEDLVFTGISQSWSLTVEECFYVIAPLVFLLLRKSLHVLYILPFLFLVIGLIIMDLVNEGGLYGFMRNRDFVLNMTFFGRSTEFFIGICLALCVKSKLFKRAPKILTVLGVFIILWAIYGISTFKEVNTLSGMSSSGGKLINNLLLPLAGIAVLYLGLIREKTWLSHFLSSPLMETMGKSSYVFYLIHVGIFSDLIGKLSTNILLVFLLLNALAYVIYIFVERPFQALIKKGFLKPMAISN